MAPGETWKLPGGVGTLAHLADGVLLGGADAVLVGTAILQATRIADILAELTSVGWPV